MATVTLPELRQDLQLIEAGPERSGAPRWLLYDPLQHRFTSIDRLSYVLLRVWGEGRAPQALAEDAWALYGEPVTPDDIERFVRFLLHAGLVVQGADGWRGFAQAAATRQSSFASRLLHGYIFFRIPLIRPQRFISATLPMVRPLGTRSMTIAALLAGVIGLHLAMREWATVLAMASDAWSLEGASLLVLAVMMVKVLHELGHAYVAAHFGCRVPIIGVAFMLGFPLLYTDVTDAWRLRSRRQRLLIDLAGVRVDLSVACLATLAWGFLPPGGARTAAFHLATAGWILSLAINLNPFMRFDGYYIVADLVRMENLQSRAFAHGRWYMREMMFGIRMHPPGDERAGASLMLALYAWATWLYRILLFAGIALAVYHLFFKAAGVVLFVAEIGYFILAPCWRELREWWRMRSRILASQRTWASVALLLVLLAAFTIPWSSTVLVPAVMEDKSLASMHAAVPARIERVRVAGGDRVAGGEVLAVLSAPAIDHQLALTLKRIAVIRLRLDRQVSDLADREQSLVLRDEMASLRRGEVSLRRQQDDLVVRAPWDGRVAHVVRALHEGRWVGRSQPLFLLDGATGRELHGYLSEPELWRVEVGADGLFVPDDLALPALPVRLTSIAQAASPAIERRELAASHGGPIADTLDRDNRPVPAEAQYRVLAAPTRSPAGMPARSVTGVIRLGGRAESFAARAWRQILKVLVRESGV